MQIFQVAGGVYKYNSFPTDTLRAQKHKSKRTPETWKCEVRISRIGISRSQQPTPERNPAPLPGRSYRPTTPM